MLQQVCTCGTRIIPKIVCLRQVPGSKVRCYLYTYLYTYRSEKGVTQFPCGIRRNDEIPYNMTLGDIRRYAGRKPHNPKVESAI